MIDVNARRIVVREDERAESWDGSDDSPKQYSRPESRLDYNHEEERSSFRRESMEARFSRSSSWEQENDVPEKMQGVTMAEVSPERPALMPSKSPATMPT